MNLIFKNSFDRNVGEGRVVTGHVAICEENGKWEVIWSEPTDGGSFTQEKWYEGGGWNEMLTAFRYQVAAKISAGFVPVIDGTFPDPERQKDRWSMRELLHYYSELNPNDTLYAKLRQWRREKASELGILPYMIANNRMLNMVACFVPHTKEELLQIPGFGETKSTQYGAGIIGITKEWERTTQFPLDWAANQIDHQDFLLWRHKQRELKFKGEYDRSMQKRKLLSMAHEGSHIIEIQEELGITRRELIQWIEELEQAGYAIDSLIEAGLEGMTDEERDKILATFAEKGDRYLKPVALAVYDEEKLKNNNAEGIYDQLRLLRILFRRTKGEAVQVS